MAVTISAGSDIIEGQRKVWEGTVTFDSSYPTGGEAFDPTSSLGFVVVDSVIVEPADGYVFEWDSANSLILAYWVDTTTDGAPLAEVVNATDLSSVVAKVTVKGH